MVDRGPQLAGICIALLTLSILAVSLRSYVRLFLTKSFGYDDWIMLVTLFWYALYCIFALLGIHHGTGKHVDQLTPQQFSAAMQMWFYCEIFYGLSSTFTKLAAGSLLLRLTTERIHTRIIWTVMIVASVFGIAFVAQIIAQCQPVSFFWSATRIPSEGHCMNPKVILGFTYAHAAVSSLGDWTFGILPAFIVKGLNMGFRTKASVVGILCLANIGSIATLIRIDSIHQISTSTDFLYATVDLAIWSSVEVGVGIVAASMATYRPLFRSFFKIGSTINRATSRGNDSHRFRGSGYFRHGAPQNIGLQDVEREHKAALSQTSTSEIFGGPSSGRGYM